MIIKADVQGSVEALASSLQKIEVEGVRVNIVHSAVGAINESDITLAEASNALVIGFNVRPTAEARNQAEADDVEVRLHSIIYKVIEEMEDAMKGMLDPEYEEKSLVRQSFVKPSRYPKLERSVVSWLFVVKLPVIQVFELSVMVL